MMDNVDHESRPVKGHGNPLPHEGLGNNVSRCSSVASGLNGSETSILLTKLQDEIDFGVVVDEMVQDSFLQTKIKSFFEKLHQLTNVVVNYNDMDEKERKRYQQTRHLLLHVPTLQELLLKIGFSKNMEDLQSYLIAADRTCLLSENEALKLELNDAQGRHHTVVSGLHFSLQSVERENKGAQHSLHQSIRHQQDTVILMEQKLKEYGRQVISLQRYLLESNEKVHSLQKTLCSSEVALQSAQQELEGTKQQGLDLQAAHRASQDHNQSLRRSLLCAGELAQSLRHSVGELEQKIELHQRTQASEGEWVKSLRRRADASEEKVSSLESSLKASEEDISSLRQSLRASEESVACFGQSQRTTEERCHSLQQKLHSAEEAVRAAQGCLRAAEDEAKRLKEALGSLEEKTLGLQDTLLARESHTRSTTAQRQALERGKKKEEGERERLLGLIRSLRGCEEEHCSRAKRHDEELRVAKERLVLLQDSVSRMEGCHTQETARLEHQLLKADNKATATEKKLRAHVVKLNTQLVKAQVSANRELEGVTVYERELQDTIQDLRQELQFQTTEKEGALQSLRMRQRDLAEVQHHLQADLLKCSQGCKPGRHSTPRKEQREELDTLRAALRSVNHEHVLTDGPRRRRKKESAKGRGHGHRVTEGRRDTFPYRPSRSAWRDTTPPPADSAAPSWDSTTGSSSSSSWLHGGSPENNGCHKAYVSSESYT